MKIKLIATAVAGLITGSVTTYIFTRRHYEKVMIQNENEYRKTIMDAAEELQRKKSAKNAAMALLSETEEGTIPAPSNKDCDDSLFTEKGMAQYTDYAASYAPKDGAPVMQPTAKPVIDRCPPEDPTPVAEVSQILGGPYNIEPDEYGDRIDYEQIGLEYYMDGVVKYADADTIIDGYKLSNMIGSDFKDYFEETGDDCIYFRNDKTRAEYCVEKVHEYYNGVLNHD